MPGSEDHERVAPTPGAADREETRLAWRMLRIGSYQRLGVRENVLDFVDRNAMPLTFAAVAIVPLETGEADPLHRQIL